VLAVALTGLVGHLYGASTLYRADPWSATALSTVAALAALGLGVLFADGSRGVALLAVSDTSGGRLLRRLVPAAVLAPVVLGWATLALQSTLHLRQGIATALLVVALIALLLGLVVRLAAALHALDEERERRAAGERAALQRVTESEQRYRLLTDLIPQHIWTTDAEGYHTWFSRRWYEFTGMDHRESEGQGWATRLHPADRERTLARWRHSLQTGEPYAIEYRFLGASGRYHWFLGQALPVRDASGRIVEWFGTLTDISDIRRLTESRASLMRGFGHDVRNALGTAHLQADMLDRGLLPGEVSAAQRQSIAVIRRSIRHALRMSDDLLELAQAEAGQLPLAREPTALQGLVAEVMGDFQQQARAAGLAVQYHVPVDALAMVDPARLRQILANLLTNAAKYAPNGRLDVIVESPATGGPRGGDWVAIRVSDTGPGIPPDQVEAIFHEGVRLAPIAVEGTGIGLAISRTLARLMGGDLTVASEPGRGSTFTLWLPPASRLH
jgi:PAS domain S-box-containing protein